MQSKSVSQIKFFEPASATAQATQGLLDIDEPNFDFRLIDDQQTVSLAQPQTHFGFVLRGEVGVGIDQRAYPLCSGMHFVVPAGADNAGKVDLRIDGSVIVVSQSNYQGLFRIGGPIEKKGRLQYIDGCSDTLLIPPVVKGDPCLNLLKIPPDTNQTFHVHPSFRFGVIVSGNGFCDWPGGTHVLHPGSVFYIPSDGEHRFRTRSDALSVIAFHPESDFGPEDDNHPMVNKTIVNGVSASQLSYQERKIVADKDPS